MMGCVWHDSNLTAAYIGAQYFTRFPSQDPLHELGGTAGAWRQKEGNLSEQPTQGLQVMHASSVAWFYLFFICLLLLTVAFSVRQVIPGYIPVAPR